MMTNKKIRRLLRIDDKYKSNSILLKIFNNSEASELRLNNLNLENIISHSTLSESGVDIKVKKVL